MGEKDRQTQNATITTDDSLSASYDLATHLLQRPRETPSERGMEFSV